MYEFTAHYTCKNAENNKDYESDIANTNKFSTYSRATGRALRAPSGAPWVRKFGKLSVPENLVMT